MEFTARNCERRFDSPLSYRGGNSVPRMLRTNHKMSQCAVQFWILYDFLSAVYSAITSHARFLLSKTQPLRPDSVVRVLLPSSSRLFRSC